jgi:hypothetical protein
VSLPPSKPPFSQPDPEPNVDQSRRTADSNRWPTRPDSPVTVAIRAGHEGNDPSWEAAPVSAADDDLDLVAEVNHRPGRTTVLLIAGILATVAFIGGVAVQKNFGETSTAALPGAATGGFAGRAAGANGFGGFPGAGQAGGAAPGAAAGPGATAGAAGGAAATPVVVGTVTKLSGSALTVKNLGGKSVKVTVPEGATVTLVAGKSLTTLKTGATVSVAGTTATDGTVTATSITVRS